MSRICNFPISPTKCCRQLVADSKANCGRHKVDFAEEQPFGSVKVSAKIGTWCCKSDEVEFADHLIIAANNNNLHVWVGSVDSAQCAIHGDLVYQTLCQLAGERQPSCLKQPVCFHDNNGRLHLLGGPAVIYVDGSEEWWVSGKLHRDDGPAIVYSCGTKEWYWHGKRVSGSHHAKLKLSSAMPVP